MDFPKCFVSMEVLAVNGFIFSFFSVWYAASQWFTSLEFPHRPPPLVVYAATTRKTRYLWDAASLFRHSCEWASRRGFKTTQTVSLSEDFLTSTLVERLGHSPQEPTITNEIALKPRLVLESIFIIWRACGVFSFSLEKNTSV